MILSFLVASVALTLMPGPDNIFVLTESLSKGSRHGIAISIGLCLGVLVHTLAAATGISIIVLKSPLAFSIIKYLGAAYLFYLAWHALQEVEPEQIILVDRLFMTSPPLKLIRTGFLMNILNPKVALFFIAFLPQFISEQGWHITKQMIFLGVLFMIQAFLLFSSFAILSGRLAPVLNRPRFWKTTKWAKVSILSILAITLLIANK